MINDSPYPSADRASTCGCHPAPPAFPAQTTRFRLVFNAFIEIQRARWLPPPGCQRSRRPKHPRSFAAKIPPKNNFNYFGPWTADVQGPLPPLSPMSMAMPADYGCPPPLRAGPLSCSVASSDFRAQTTVYRALPVLNESAALFPNPPGAHFQTMICITNYASMI